VVLDPAHGGPDAGSRGAAGVVESEIVLNFARAIRQTLQTQGFRVLLTREGNQDPSFDDRSSMINGLRNALFITLHVSSTGPVGTVRTYSYGEITTPPAVSATGRPLTEARSGNARPAISRTGLIPWDRAQESYLNASQRLAQLTQIQIAQKFGGSPELSLPAAVRQLRTIAAPAIAIEISSVAVSGSAQLAQMTPRLADALTHAIVDFQAANGGALPAAPVAAGGTSGSTGVGTAPPPGGAH
jgi:N-acetylmuramoyl-L-alanine amidase